MTGRYLVRIFKHFNHNGLGPHFLSGGDRHEVIVNILIPKDTKNKITLGVHFRPFDQSRKIVQKHGLGFRYLRKNRKREYRNKKHQHQQSFHTF